MEELKRKSIKYEVLTHESASSVILVRIAEQSHRGEEFGANGEEKFVASNGLHLYSHVSPAVTDSIKDYGVFMRGSDEEDDNDILVFKNREDFLLFKQAVREYNEFDFGVDTRISKVAINKAKENIRLRVRGTIEELEGSLESLTSAKTELQVLEIKKDIMLHLTDLPLNSECCPFCLYFDFPNKNKGCSNCEYGKKKKRCFEKDSTYNRIIDAKVTLREAIYDYPL